MEKINKVNLKVATKLFSIKPYSLNTGDMVILIGKCFKKV
jgi:hypothetical protein